MKKIFLTIVLLFLCSVCFAGQGRPEPDGKNTYAELGEDANFESITTTGDITAGGTTSQYTGYYGNTLTNTAEDVWELDGALTLLTQPITNGDSIYYSASKALGGTSATVTSVLDFAITEDRAIGGTINYTVTVAQFADFVVTALQSETGVLTYSAYNLGGTVAYTLDEVATPTDAVSAGTIAPVIAFTALAGGMTLTSTFGSNLAGVLFPTITLSVTQNGLTATITEH